MKKKMDFTLLFIVFSNCLCVNYFAMCQSTADAAEIVPTQANQSVSSQSMIAKDIENHANQLNLEMKQNFQNITSGFLTPLVQFNNRVASNAAQLPAIFAARGAVIGSKIAAPIQRSTLIANNAFAIAAIVDSSAFRPPVDETLRSPTFLDRIEALNRTLTRKFTQKIQKPLDRLRTRLINSIIWKSERIARKMKRIGDRIERTGGRIEALGKRISAASGLVPVTAVPELSRESESISLKPDFSQQSNNSQNASSNLLANASEDDMMPLEVTTAVPTTITHGEFSTMLHSNQVNSRAMFPETTATPTVELLNIESKDIDTSTSSFLEPTTAITSTESSSERSESADKYSDSTPNSIGLEYRPEEVVPAITSDVTNFELSPFDSTTQSRIFENFVTPSTTPPSIIVQAPSQVSILESPQTEPSTTSFSFDNQANPQDSVSFFPQTVQPTTTSMPIVVPSTTKTILSFDIKEASKVAISEFSRTASFDVHVDPLDPFLVTNPQIMKSHTAALRILSNPATITKFVEPFTTLSPFERAESRLLNPKFSYTIPPTVTPFLHKQVELPISTRKFTYTMPPTTTFSSVKTTAAQDSISEYQDTEQPTTVSMPIIDPSIQDPILKSHETVHSTAVSMPVIVSSTQNLISESLQTEQPTTVSMPIIDPSTQDLISESLQTEQPTTVSMPIIDPSIQDPILKSQETVHPTAVSMPIIDPLTQKPFTDARKTISPTPNTLSLDNQTTAQDLFSESLQTEQTTTAPMPIVVPSNQDSFIESSRETVPPSTPSATTIVSNFEAMTQVGSIESAESAQTSNSQTSTIDTISTTDSNAYNDLSTSFSSFVSKMDFVTQNSIIELTTEPSAS